MSNNILITNAEAGDGPAILDVMRPWNMHHVPSPEMEALDLSKFFIAKAGDEIVGAAGYKILSPGLGKTTLLGVLPEYSGHGIGSKLQYARCEAMYLQGVKRIITNSDLPATIAWYQKNYGYQIVGSLEKISEFGSPDIDHWTTLEMDLESYMRNAEK